MREEEGDPFDGLVLDEEFVKAAKAYEPPARTREAIARHGRSSPRDWETRPVAPARRRRRTGAGLGVVAAVLVLAFVAWQTGWFASPSPTGVRAAAVALSPSPSPEMGLDRSVWTTGDCYTWDQRKPRPDVAVPDVPCARPHLFQYVRSTTVPGLPLAPYPTDVAWNRITEARCTGFVTAFLHHVLDPRGRYEVDALTPRRADWALGDRTLECGIFGRRLHVLGAAPTAVLPLFSGTVDTAHQSLDYPVGTCLRSTRTDEGSVPCTALHDEEVVGAATVAGPAAPPSAAAFGRLALAPCQALISGYLGYRFSPSATRQTGWTDISPESWRAGERTFDCLLGFTPPVYGSHSTPGHAV